MEDHTQAAPRQVDSKNQALFAAGCFWGVEDLFRSAEGVTDAISGYTGGGTDSPTYHDVCSGKTGHAEAVLVTYDPAKTTYKNLVDLFFRMHDPTTLNRQGPDVGTQYRSAIFVAGPEQRSEALRAIAEYQPQFVKPVVTEVSDASTFWPAEEYHQQYFAKRGMSGCHVLRSH